MLVHVFGYTEPENGVKLCAPLPSVKT